MASAQRGKHCGERRLGRFVAAFDRVVAVEQDLGLDDGNDRGFLAQRRVASQGMRISIEAGVAGNTGTDGNDRAPLGETSAELEIFLQPASQTVQPLGDFFSRRKCKIVRTFVHFDAGDDTFAREKLRKRLVSHLSIVPTPTPDPRSSVEVSRRTGP